MPFPTLERALSVIDTHAGKMNDKTKDTNVVIKNYSLVIKQVVYSTFFVNLAGFNIEVKWDMENMDGTRESHNAFEMNIFMDAILKTVLKNAKSRKIVFSTFNPDVCTV